MRNPIPDGTHLQHNWAGTLLNAWGGHSLNVKLDIGMSPLGMSPVNCVERNGSERSPFRECRNSAAVQVPRRASQERSPPPRLRSESRPRAPDPRGGTPQGIGP